MASYDQVRTIKGALSLVTIVAIVTTLGVLICLTHYLLALSANTARLPDPKTIGLFQIRWVGLLTGFIALIGWTLCVVIEIGCIAYFVVTVWIMKECKIDWLRSRIAVALGALVLLAAACSIRFNYPGVISWLFD